MSFISELYYRSGGFPETEFVEFKYTAGTDVSEKYIAIYDASGNFVLSYAVSGLTAHDDGNGNDTYILFFDDAQSGLNFTNDHTVALYTSSDGGTTRTGTDSFISAANGSAVTGGPFAGQSPTVVGEATAAGKSVQSTDGSSYSEADKTPIACFLSGTLIATQNGEVAIEDLTAGDQIALQGGGFATLRWVGYSDADASGENHESTAPICIPAHAFGADMPKRDLYVSPNHRIWLQHGMLELHFATNEVLVAAKHLVGWRGITQATDVPSPRYFHMLFDQHEIVISDGLPTESFHPAAIVTTGFDRETREELLALFPEMDHMALQNTTAASLCLKAYEVPVAMHAIAA